ncbi:MAG: sugar ABC transporter permease [Butyrivibrio sp.]|nr:sugar ABC transporter permease [Butyrivibrio sp.]
MAANQKSAAAVDINKKNRKAVRYNKWGYIFIIPFIVTFLLFQLIPLVNTFYYSLFEYYRDGRKVIGPNWIGIENYVTLFKTDLLKYAGNTAIMWIMGFIPQIIVSLLLAQWFSDTRLKIKGSAFFKTVIYLPNLIMASAFSMLFFALFSANGPVNHILVNIGVLKQPIDFINNIWGARSLVAAMNFLMWFGNTTILLMAGIMGIDVSLYEAAEVDGANSWQRFTKITLPLLKPILIYVIITSLIGGIQMFDVPQILTDGSGGINRTSMSLIMYLNKHLYSKNYGMGGALSVVLFVITTILSLTVYNIMYRKKDN